MEWILLLRSTRIFSLDHEDCDGLASWNDRGG